MKTPNSMRYKIALIGRTNAGKSSLMNAICEQNRSLVSDVPGTTTDSVGKSYELIGFGPVVFYDTAGLDDSSKLGEQRKKATLTTLNNSNFAIIVVEGGKITNLEKAIIKMLDIPYLIVNTKADIFPCQNGVSAKTGQGIKELREKLISIIPKQKEAQILKGLIDKNDKVLLVCPIDTSAPKGRMILPQNRTLREILDMHAIAISVQPQQIPEALKFSPDLVVTDSQAIKKVAELIPENISLTTFSVLFGKLKGEHDIFLKGARSIDNLKNGDKVLISEACSHHTMEDDIGRKQLPKLLKEYTKKDLEFMFTRGKSFIEDVSSIALVLHCGSCMLTRRETLNRIKKTTDAGIPITNYGMAISKCHGLLERVTLPIKKKKYFQQLDIKLT